MRLDKIAALLITASFFFTLFAVNSARADDTIDNLVDATFEVNLESATDYKINVTMDVSKIKVFDTTYYSSDIQNLASSTNVSDIENMTDIKHSLREFIDKQLSEDFSKANVTATTSRPSYEGGLFKSEYRVNLTSSFFGLSENVDCYSLINGVLDMSAIVNYSFNLNAEPGWNNTFMFNLGQTYSFKRTTGVLSGTNIIWSLKNWNGINPNTTAEIQLKKVSPTTKAGSENIFLEFGLNSENTNDTILTSNILLRSVDVRTYSFLPSFIYNLNFMPADGIRLFADNGLLSWNDAYEKTVEPLQQKIKSNIEESSFNQTLDFVFAWDNETTTDCATPYDVSKMDDKPNIKAILTDENVHLKICNVSSRAFFGLINSGAGANISKDDINFGDNLQNISYDYNVTLYLPDGVYLDNKNVYTWNESLPISGGFKSDNVLTNYSSENKSSIIEIEIKTTDLNLLSFLTGKTELTFGLDFNEDNNYNVTALPKEFTLPRKISLDYLNSDAFRLCVEENIFDANSVDAFLESGKNDFGTILKRLLPGLEASANINRDVFENSLAWNGDISKMDANTPVKTSLSGHSSYPVAFGLSIAPPKFDIPTRIFNFSGLPNQDVTYKVIFPQGISIDVSDPLNKAVEGKLSDGRQYFEISFSASESNLTVDVSCKMVPSALFIIGIFIPCIVTLIIAIVLIIVIYIIRRKRREKIGGPVTKDKEEESTGYEGEDYYIPPPPDSK